MLTVERFQSLRTAGPFLATGEPRTLVSLTGDDRTKLLQNLCTNDVARLSEGAGCEAFLCNAKGGVLHYVAVWNLGDELWLETEPGFGPALVKHLDRYIIREKAAPSDWTAASSQRSLIGPGAVQSLAAAFGADGVPPAHLTLAKTVIGSQRVSVCRRDFGNIPVYAVRCPLECAAEIDGRLKVGSLPIASADEVAALAILAGVPAMGEELQEGNLPQEADRIERTISFTKGCYIGQETVARLDAYGHVNKVLRGVSIDGAHVGLAGAKIVHQGKEVGAVRRSAVFETTAGPETRFLAVLKIAAATLGAEVSVESADGKRTGKVRGLPFANPA